MHQTFYKHYVVQHCKYSTMLISKITQNIPDPLPASANITNQNWAVSHKTIDPWLSHSYVFKTSSHVFFFFFWVMVVTGHVFGKGVVSLLVQHSLEYAGYSITDYVQTVFLNHKDHHRLWFTFKRVLRRWANCSVSVQGSRNPHD